MEVKTVDQISYSQVVSGASKAASGSGRSWAQVASIKPSAATTEKVMTEIRGIGKYKVQKNNVDGGGSKLTGSESNKPPKSVMTTESVAEGLKNKTYANILQVMPDHEKGRERITVVSQCSHPKKVKLPDEDKQGGSLNPSQSMKITYAAALGVRDLTDKKETCGHIEHSSKSYAGVVKKYQSHEKSSSSLSYAAVLKGVKHGGINKREHTTHQDVVNKITQIDIIEEVKNQQQITREKVTKLWHKYIRIDESICEEGQCSRIKTIKEKLDLMSEVEHEWRSHKVVAMEQWTLHARHSRPFKRMGDLYGSCFETILFELKGYLMRAKDDQKTQNPDRKDWLLVYQYAWCLRNRVIVARAIDRDSPSSSIKGSKLKDLDDLLKHILSDHVLLFIKEERKMNSCQLRDNSLFVLREYMPLLKCFGANPDGLIQTLSVNFSNGLKAAWRDFYTQLNSQFPLKAFQHFDTYVFNNSDIVTQQRTPLEFTNCKNHIEEAINKVVERQLSGVDKGKVRTLCEKFKTKGWVSGSQLERVIRWADNQTEEVLEEDSVLTSTLRAPSMVSRVPKIKLPIVKGGINESEVERVLESRNRRDDLKKELVSCGEAQKIMEKPECWFKGMAVYLMHHEERLMRDRDDYLSVVKVMEIAAYRYFEFLIRITENFKEARRKGKGVGTPLLDISFEYNHFIKPIRKHITNQRIILMFNKIKHQYCEAVIWPIENHVLDCYRKNNFPVNKYFVLQSYFNTLFEHLDDARDVERKQIIRAYGKFISCVLGGGRQQWTNRALNLGKVFWVIITQILENPMTSKIFPVVKNDIEQLLISILEYLAGHTELVKDASQYQVMIGYVYESEFNYLLPEVLKIYVAPRSHGIKIRNPFKSKDDFLDWIKPGWKVTLSSIENPKTDCRRGEKSEPGLIAMPHNPAAQAGESQLQSWARVVSEKSSTMLSVISVGEQEKKKPVKTASDVYQAEVIHVSVEEALDKLEFDIFSNKAIKSVIPTRERVSNLLYGHEKIQNSLEGVLKHKKKKTVDRENQQQLAREWLLILTSIHLRDIIGSVYGCNGCAQVFVLCVQRFLDQVYDVLRLDPSKSRYGHYLAKNCMLLQDIHLTLLHLINAGLEEKKCYAFRDQLSGILSDLATETTHDEELDSSESVSPDEDLFHEREEDVLVSDSNQSNTPSSDGILKDNSQRSDHSTLIIAEGYLVQSTATRSWAQMVKSSASGKVHFVHEAEPTVNCQMSTTRKYSSMEVEAHREKTGSPALPLGAVIASLDQKHNLSLYKEKQVASSEKAWSAVVANPKGKNGVEIIEDRVSLKPELIRDNLFEKYNRPSERLVYLAVTRKSEFENLTGLFRNGFLESQDLYRSASNWLEAVIDYFEKLEKSVKDEADIWQLVSCVRLARYTFGFCIDYLENDLKNNSSLFSNKVADIAHLLPRVESLCNDVMGFDWHTLSYEKSDRLINKQVQYLKEDLRWLDATTIRRPSVLYAVKSEGYCKYLCWLFQGGGSDVYHHVIEFFPKLMGEISEGKCESLNDTILNLAMVITPLYMDEAFHRIICLAKGDIHDIEDFGLVRLRPVISLYEYFIETGILDEKNRTVANHFLERSRVMEFCYQSTIPSFVVEKLNYLFSESSPDIKEICRIIKVSVLLNFKNDSYIEQMLESPECVENINSILGLLHGLVLQLLLKNKIPDTLAHTIIEIFDYSASLDSRLSGQELVDVKRHVDKKSTTHLEPLLGTKGFLWINYTDRQLLLDRLREHTRSEMAQWTPLSVASERVKYSCVNVRRHAFTPDLGGIRTRLANPDHLHKYHSTVSMIASYDEILEELKSLDSVLKNDETDHWSEQLHTQKRVILYCFHVLNLVKHNVFSGRHIRFALATCERYHNIIQLCIKHLDSQNFQRLLSKDQHLRLDSLISKVFCTTLAALKMYKKCYVKSSEIDRPAPYYPYQLKKLELLGRSMLNNTHELKSTGTANSDLLTISSDCIRVFHECLKEISEDIAKRISNCILKRENTEDDENYGKFTQEYNRLNEMRKAIWNIEGCLLSDIAQRFDSDMPAHLYGDKSPLL
ncbi:hypothetical protein [Endozoicomonas elysicola]|uniref:Uncharacterized protein n=1 Tax=Endozoicomonas elysicola TaxID=305900 RepID=A0A081K6C4_9GAMM|nr:hypothetical protein [Endozoicomonas elysicola]KEI69700.1 hypothetical protein GV64_02130 [Endozoicomonas elysicola]